MLLHENVIQFLDKIKTSNDINTWVLSLLTLTHKELKQLLKQKDIPISVKIIGEYLLDTEAGVYNKVKFLSNYINENVVADAPDTAVKFELEFINSETLKKTIINTGID